MHTGRIFIHRICGNRSGDNGLTRPVVYWMHREHRVLDNWALLHARDLALERGVPLLSVYCLAPSFLGATIRQFGFLLRGLQEIESDLAALNIPLYFLRGDPVEQIGAFAVQVGAGAVVADFDVLRVKRGWLTEVARGAGCEVREVDGRNVVPCRVVSDRREYAARTIRPKVHRLLPEYLDEFPVLEPHVHAWRDVPAPVDWARVRAGLGVDRSVGEVAWLVPGETAARAALDEFVSRRLHGYAGGRNDPTQEATSGLSPYLHFGMLSAQRVALAVTQARVGRGGADESAAAFLEELVVRRELADNFCFHAQEYDTPSCFPDWAAATLARHEADAREHLYELEELETAATHDPLWNAAQTSLVMLGTMHGYLRMYWAKKILEWSANVEQAMRCAVFLNDRYFLDGRDSNGYTGIAWSMGGVHDRPWKERAIFGMVRYMNFNGARRKFNVQAYIDGVAQRVAGQAARDAGLAAQNVKESR